MGRAFFSFRKRSKRHAWWRKARRRWLFAWFAAVVALIPVQAMAAPAGTAVPAAPANNAQAAAVMDVQSGRLLYSKNGDKPLPVASLTKIMTAIVAIEYGTLSDPVTVSSRAFGKEGSSIYLKLGQEMSLHDMLYGLMLRSGNDAATAIAEHVGGSLEGFVYMMNREAEAIGMTNSHFDNPHGLDSKTHYASADDMAKLSAYALRNPIFREIVKTQVKRVPGNGDGGGDYVWYNKNKMLALYDGADGVKTGYTKTAKRCLVSSATRDGRQVVVVTINDGSDWADHARLLQYGFEQFKNRALVSRGDRVAAGFVAAQSFTYPLTEEEAAHVGRTFETEAPKSVNAGLGIAGRLHLFVNEREVGSVPVVAEGSARLTLPVKSAFRPSLAANAGSGGGFGHMVLALVRQLFRMGG